MFPIAEAEDMSRIIQLVKTGPEKTPQRLLLLNMQLWTGILNGAADLSLLF